MNARIKLPQWCVDIIANPPQSGDGFHLWLFRAARALWKCGRTENDTIATLENAASICGRHVPIREIQDAVTNSQRPAFQPDNFQRLRWPKVDEEKRKAVTEKGPGLVDLWESSPVRIEDNDSHNEEIIDVLFPGNPLLCCGAKKETARTASREEWRGRMSKLQFIVPNPMTATIGINQLDEVSHRCLNNTGPRRFLVVEFDTGTTDEHAALLLHLAEWAPMALAVHSGQKSLHGWFYSAGVAEGKIVNFFRHACSLGADPMLWTPCQLARMPDGTRDNGKKQTVYFLNPGVIR